ncbi:MAG: hypothetical protein EBV20_07705 [Betaproteobacteria bacterium]|jgi:hypothetical protein|nr:hypothetical protein [Betaproteobacteria bacterium]NBP45737.1 hypothetical protein [Betaproteobacteria bacterium]
MTSSPLNHSLIFGPVFALMGLVLVVMVLAYRERVRQFKAQRLHPQKVPTRAEFAAAIKDTRCADNFANLFETPVMFHVACLGLYVTQTVSMAALVLAWVYVLTRIVHSRVQCGSNVVLTRFKCFAASMAVLVALWAVWGVSLLG